MDILKTLLEMSVEIETLKGTLKDIDVPTEAFLPDAAKAASIPLDPKTKRMLKRINGKKKARKRAKLDEVLFKEQDVWTSVKYEQIGRYDKRTNKIKSESGKIFSDEIPAKFRRQDEAMKFALTDIE